MLGPHAPASGAFMVTLKPTDDKPLELFLLYCPGDLQQCVKRQPVLAYSLG